MATASESKPTRPRVGRPLRDQVRDCQAEWFEEELEVGGWMHGGEW